MKHLITQIKKTSILALLVFIPVGCSSTKIKPISDLTRMNVSGHVVSIKESTYDSLEDYENKLGLHKISLFNDNGNIKTSQLLNSDNSVSQKTEYTYHDRYLAKTIQLNADNEPMLTTKYIYDSKGRLVKINYKDKENSFTKYAYQYDDKDNKILELTYDDNSKPASKTTYDYNQKNQLTEENWLYDDGTLYVKIKIQYDPVSGNKKTERRERGNGNQYMSLNYNEKGDIIKAIEWDSSSQSEVQASTMHTDYQYEYDERGNWTTLKTISSANNKITSVIVRELEYRN